MPDSSELTWLDPSRPVPDVRTEVPGPRAREVLRTRRGGDQPVAAPGLPDWCPRRASGALIEDIDGNLFLDFNAGIAVNSTGHAHPRVVAGGGPRQAADLLHYSASDFYLPIYSEMCEALAETAPMAGPVRVVPDQLRHRGRGGRAQAGQVRDRPPYVLASTARSTAAATARSA